MIGWWVVAKTRGPSVKRELLFKSREAALNAVQTFNNPLTTFKTETFIVLMSIAWTYLLHAYYRQEGVEYRYHVVGPKRRKFDYTTSGAFKYWELRRCLNDKSCPLDEPTRGNLRFLIGLRDEIEHHRSTGVDEAFTGRYIACILNYDREISRLFGQCYSIAKNMTYSLQLRDLTSPSTTEESVAPLPSNIAKYIIQFDSEIPPEDFQHPHFSYRLLFVRKLTSKQSQADKAIEFIKADSDLAGKIDKEYWVQKEVERPKYLPTRIVELMREEGYEEFGIHQHTLLWKDLNAKNPGRGYGVMVEKAWYWYDRWVEKVREHCASNKALYGYTTKDSLTE